jgi:hypothetical protein
MASSGILRRVTLVRTDVSEERIAFIIGVTRIGELGITLLVTSNRRRLRKNIRVTRIGELGTTLLVTSNRRWLRKNIIIFLRSLRRFLVTANVVPSSPILVTLMKGGATFLRNVDS